MDQYFHCRDNRTPDEKLEDIFAAASQTICDYSQELIQRYAQGDAQWADVQTAVGHSLVINGVLALVSCVSSMPGNEIAELCNEVDALIVEFMDREVAA